VSWEALTTISTAFTGLVILLTVLYAARQLRVLNEQSKAMSAQLEHLRRATQLEGTLAIFDQLATSDLAESYRFILNEFEAQMKDERFRGEALGRAPDPAVHKEALMLRRMERVGTIVKNGLLDADVLLDFMGLFILESWQRLKPLALQQRALYNAPRLWENFEYLADLADKDFRRKSAQPNP